MHYEVSCAFWPIVVFCNCLHLLLKKKFHWWMVRVSFICAFKYVESSEKLYWCTKVLTCSVLGSMTSPVMGSWLVYTTQHSSLPLRGPVSVKVSIAVQRHQWLQQVLLKWQLTVSESVVYSIITAGSMGAGRARAGSRHEAGCILVRRQQEVVLVSHWGRLE